MKLLASNETEVPCELGHETRKSCWRMVNTPDISLEIFLWWKCNPYQLTWFQNFVLQIITASCPYSTRSCCAVPNSVCYISQVLSPLWLIDLMVHKYSKVRTAWLCGVLSNFIFSVHTVSYSTLFFPLNSQPSYCTIIQ